MLVWVAAGCEKEPLHPSKSKTKPGINFEAHLAEVESAVQPLLMTARFQRVGSYFHKCAVD